MDDELTGRELFRAPARLEAGAAVQAPGAVVVLPGPELEDELTASGGVYGERVEQPLTDTPSPVLRMHENHGDVAELRQRRAQPVVVAPRLRQRHADDLVRLGRDDRQRVGLGELGPHPGTPVLVRYLSARGVRELPHPYRRVQPVGQGQQPDEYPAVKNHVASPHPGAALPDRQR